jgi:uncharacterized protein YndB with AHSA1/START domain
MSFTLTLQIDRSVEDVFEYIADYRSTPEWFSGVQKVEKTAGGMGVGTRYRVYRDGLLGGTASHQLEITNYVLNKEVEFTSIDEPNPFSYQYTVEADGDSTNLSVEGTIKASGAPGAALVLTPIAVTMFKRTMRDNLAGLKKLLEASAGA